MRTTFASLTMDETKKNIKRFKSNIGIRSISNMEIAHLCGWVYVLYSNSSHNFFIRMYYMYANIRSMHISKDHLLEGFLHTKNDTPQK